MHLKPEEKNVLTILTIARIVENTLWYCLPPKSEEGFSVEERKQRGVALKALTAEGSPFAANCNNNGDNGKKLREDLEYFIEDVYSDPGRIVTVDINNKVHVESSLILELFSSIVALRIRLEAFLAAAKEMLKQRDAYSDEFAKLLETDLRYYHCFAGKISCMLIAQKFLDLNKNAQTYAQSYSKQHGGINPNEDPNFNVKNDPSFRMLENEFHELNNDMVLILNNYGEEGSDFAYARAKVYSDCKIFTGEKKTTDPEAFFKMFASYFDRMLALDQPALNRLFQEAGEAVREDQVAAKAE